MMKRKQFKFLICMCLISCMIPSAAFADISSECRRYDEVIQLKDEITEGLKGDKKLSSQEVSRIVESTDKYIINEFIEEKMDLAVETINGENIAADMIVMPDGSQHGVAKYDLGDGCELIVEFEDRPETLSTFAMSGSTDTWKLYGNRYFTANATVQCGVGSISLRLDNHYSLSINGIDEREGIPTTNLGTSGGYIKKYLPVILDKNARIPGSSDVNMYCEFDFCGMRTDNSFENSKYRLNTTVGYLAINKTTGKIQVRQAWCLTKISK